MIGKKQVSELYVPIAEYPHIGPEETLGDAIALLHRQYKEQKRGFRAVLVVDEEGHLSGVLTLKGMLRALGPGFLKSKLPRKGLQPYQGLETEFPALTHIWQEQFSEQCRTEARAKVKEVMSHVKEPVRLTDPIAKAAYLMILRDTVVLPVVDNGNVVGVIRMVDIFKQMAQALDTE